MVALKNGIYKNTNACDKTVAVIKAEKTDFKNKLCNTKIGP